MEANPVAPAVNKSPAAAGESSLKNNDSLQAEDLKLQPDSKDTEESHQSTESGDSSLKNNDKENKTETPVDHYAGSPEADDSGAQDQAGGRQEDEADADQSKMAAEDVLQHPEDKDVGAEDLKLQPDSKDTEESHQSTESGDSSLKNNDKENKTETPVDHYAGSPEADDSGAQDQAGGRQEDEADADQSKMAAEDVLQHPEDKDVGVTGQREQEDVDAGIDAPPTYHRRSTAVSVRAYLPAFVCILAILAATWLRFPSSPPPVPSKGRADIFREEIARVKLSYPSQRAALWQRSEIHLTRHLEAKRPTEPVSMILTSGRGAEKTLHCLAVHIAGALSAALNTSVLEIDGTSKALLDSDQVKLDIDVKLETAFGMKMGPAVIHRFEELPPGSTLIFYRYCDHENAAFKEASLIFTVLLEEVEQLEPQMSLSDVEEMVQDHVRDKFLSSTEPAAFDKMDVDKLGGLWSRISHLVLPVAVEKDIELKGCRS